MKMADKRGLGRGLSALMGEEDAPPRKKEGAGEAPPVNHPHTDQLEVPVEYLEPNPFQPRRTFAEEDLKELAASIKERGIIQPIIVRPKPGADGHFQIIAGERRWRAAQRAQLHEVPVRVRDFDDAQALEIAIVENVQRADLNPVEEARGYRQLMDDFGYTQDALGKFIGKSRSHIANTLRLLSLPEGVQVMLADGRLSAGHGRALIGQENVVALANEIVKKGLSVRETEALVKKGARPSGKSGKGPKPPKDADTRALETRISNAVGMKVEIDHKGEKGTVTITYRSLEQLDDICKRLAK
jgi:ParB family chromosome partitioning protein